MNIRMLEWIAFQVVIPLLFMFGTWLVTYGTPHSFIQVFAGGDLVLLAALLLLGALGATYSEQRRLQQTDDVATKYDHFFFVTLALSILAIFAYTAIKVLLMEEPLVDGANDVRADSVWLLLYSAIACVSAITWSAYVFCQLVVSATDAALAPTARI